MSSDAIDYAGREQAEVKHYFLGIYMDLLIHKTASRYDHIAYVDGFSGPWQSSGENFSDTSFGIALASLRKAKATWKGLGRDVKMSAHLVEKSPEAFAKLDAIKPKYPDIEIHTYNGDFIQIANSIKSALSDETFAFLFIDPKGWRIDIKKLEPLISRPNAEVLFNFMFDFINRAASMDSPALAEGLDKLIPFGGWRDKLKTLPASANVPDLRRAILVDAFRETLGKVGKYTYVAEVPVLRPLKDRTLYSLVYATRHEAGIKVFRSCHVKTEHKQNSVRAAAKQANQEAKSGQINIFDSSVPMAPTPIEVYLAGEQIAAKAMLLEGVPQTPDSVRYGDLWPKVLERHLVTLPDVNKMAATFRKSGELLFPDWKVGKRVPEDDYLVSIPPR